jgi:hypothetical protein
MLRPRYALVNRLDRALPEGLLVDTGWLKRHGYSRQLLGHYVRVGWLEQPARGVYRRPRGALSWQQVVISLQTLLLDRPLMVGGRTALELQGYAHYLTRTTKEIHLYGSEPPPGWLHRLSLGVTFTFHKVDSLFGDGAAVGSAVSLRRDLASDGAGDEVNASHPSLVVQPWGQWNWPLTLSSPERATLELLDELPSHESFHQVDKLFEGMTGLSPRRLQTLLAACKSVKVRRLFVFFANRHHHAWLQRLDLSKVDLGTGKRSLVRGGRLDATTQLVVPEDLDGVR